MALLSCTVVLILIASGIARFISSIRLGRIAHTLKIEIAEALRSYKEFDTIDRKVSEEEIEAFRNRYRSLYTKAKALQNNRRLSSELKKATGIDDFISAYENIRRMRNQQNAKFLAVAYLRTNLDFVLGQRDAFVDDNHYFTASESEAFIALTKEGLEQISFLAQDGTLDRVDFADRAHDLQRFVAALEEIRNAHNDEFVRRQLETHKQFFDTVLPFPLDAQQRESIVKLEDNCLVISSAGSGKTSTMVGKLMYLLVKRRIDPDRILALTYTRKAAKELSDRIFTKNLRCLTFHKLALDIIGSVTGRKPSIADEELFVGVFYDLLRRSEFVEAVVRYLEDLQSNMKLEHSYDKAADYYADREKYGIQSLYQDMDGKVIFTKSEEERKLCLYLTELGIDFKYEQNYIHDTVTRDYRQYKPDFTIYFTDPQTHRKRQIYLEHFGIDAQGNVPRWFGDGKEGGWYAANQRYRQSIEWKKQQHEAHGTVLITTSSADFHAHRIRARLREELVRAGVPIRPLSAADLYKRIRMRNRNIEKSLIQLVQSFIHLLKANRYTLEEVHAKAKKAGSARDVYIIERILRPACEAYRQALAERSEIDFTDAILQAAALCEQGKWKPYDYILVDEFQDISVDRYLLLRALRTKAPLTKLYCVGDDWQSIYRFAGSDMTLFTAFERFFGFTEECRIETTYRFGNPLIDLSSRFVQQNPNQKRKRIRPFIRGSEMPRTQIHLIAVPAALQYERIKELIDAIPASESVYILGRYTFDVNSLSSDNILHESDDRTSVRFGERKVPFLTVHASKGLEADHVVLINCNGGVRGFPSSVSDDRVLEYVLSETDPFEYGEERRVFYVGITRAKKHTYICYDPRNPSIFLSEFTDGKTVEGERCPICRKGRRIILKEGYSQNKRHYTNYGCSNRAAACPYFERIFD